jgi:hypothetical protein
MTASNINDVVGFLSRFVDSFDFERPGIDQNLGRDVAMKVVHRIHDRSHEERAGVSGIRLANESKYKAWRDKKYGVSEPNSGTGQMLSQKSLYGRTTIDSRKVTMIYGTGDPPDREVFGRAVAPAGEKRTDIEKAYIAHTGQSIHKIKRPIYEVGASDGAAVSELCQQNLNDLIRETNAESSY